MIVGIDYIKKFANVDGEKETIIGFLIAEIDDKILKAEVIDFFVWPEYRKCGVGTAIFEKAISLFKSNGIKKMSGLFHTDDMTDGWIIVTSFFKEKNCILEKNIDIPHIEGRITLDI